MLPRLGVIGPGLHLRWPDRAEADILVMRRESESEAASGEHFMYNRLPSCGLPVKLSSEPESPAIILQFQRPSSSYGALGIAQCSESRVPRGLLAPGELS